MLDGARARRACSATLVAARLVHGRSPPRARTTAPLAAALARPLPDKRIERRLEQSVDPEGDLLDTASPRACGRPARSARRPPAADPQARSRCSAVSTPPRRRPMPSVTVRGGRYVIPVRRDSRSRPGGIVHDESGERRHALHRAVRGHRAGQRAPRSGGRGGARDAAGAARADRPAPARAAGAARRWSRCASPWTTSSPARATPWRWTARCPRWPRRRQISSW